MTYVANPTDPTHPLDSDDASGGAAEFRALKSYVQGLVSGGSSLTGYAWQGFRNKLINGNFSFWQRGTNLANAVNNAYLADRWKSVGVGTTTTVSQQIFALGQGVVPNEPTYFHRTVVASVAGVNNYAELFQSIEGVRTLAGQSATFSFWAKSDAARNMAAAVTQNFGTGGAPSAAVSVASSLIALTTSWKLYTVQVTLPSIAGKTLGTNADDSLQIIFLFDAGSNISNIPGQQSGTFDIAQVQFEPGGAQTPFEMRPPATEFALCQRYYETGTEPFSFMNPLAGITTAYGDMKFICTKRRNPTVAMSGWQYSSAGVATAFTPALYSATQDKFVFQGSGLTTWNGWSGVGSWTADADF